MQRFRNGNPLPDPELPPVWASMSHSPEMGLRPGKVCEQIYEQTMNEKNENKC